MKIITITTQLVNGEVYKGQLGVRKRQTTEYAIAIWGTKCRNTGLPIAVIGYKNQFWSGAWNSPINAAMKAATEMLELEK